MSYLTITIILSLILIIFLQAFYIFKFSKIIFKFEDKIETSLDELDKQYSEISKVLEIPLFYDSNEVRSVLSSIDEARSSILKIANNLAEIDVIEEKEPEESPQINKNHIITPLEELFNKGPSLTPQKNNKK